MERLTFEGLFCDIAMCREIPCPYDGMCSQRRVWERLKEYEDAEQEGRLVVLPCAVERTVYKLSHYHDCSDNLYETCDLFAYDEGACSHCHKDKLVLHIMEASFKLSMLEDFGKTVFLTREEAEAELAGKEPAQPNDDPEWKKRMMQTFLGGR